MEKDMAAHDERRRGNEHNEAAWRSEPWESADRWREDEPLGRMRTGQGYSGWRDRDHQASRRGYGGETGRDTSWGGASSGTYGQSRSRGLPWPDTAWRGGEWREGPFAGRGPKGYKRSDTRILEDVSDKLSDAPDIDASEMEVTVSNGEVTLSGTVRTRYEKRRSEDVSESVPGVRDVHNSLRVSLS